MARLLTGHVEGREQQELARLDTFAGDLSTAAERDVHNRLLGYLEARLGDDIALQTEFLALVRQISLKVGIEPPAPMQTAQQVAASNSVVVQTSGGSAYVQVAQPVPLVIKWAAMTGPEAARRLEAMSLEDAAEALTDMEPTLAARRLTHVEPDRAVQMLSHIDEGVAAEMLLKLTAAGQAAALLAQIEPPQAAAILDMTVADWTVARLAEMEPGRALALLAVMGTKRTDDLLAAMENQQAVRLLSAVGKVLTDQNRVRTTFDLAQQEAERIAGAARLAAEEAVQLANAEAESLRAAALSEVAELKAVALQEIDDLRHGAQETIAERPAGADARIDTVQIPRPAIPGAGASSARHRVQTGAGNRAGSGRLQDDEPFALAIEYFLVSHDNAGRPRVHQEVLETVIAGAVLCELVQADLIDIVDGQMLPSDGTRSTDAVTDLAIPDLSGPSAQPIPSWIRDTRKELFLRIAQRLSDTGAVIPVVRRWNRSRPGLVYRPTDDAAASEPAIRIVRSLLSAATPDSRTYLLAALMNITQLHHVLPIALKPKQTRDLLAQMMSRTTASPSVLAVLAGIETAVATTAITPRIR